MSVESLRGMTGAQMVPAGPDYMGGWYATLPAERRFAPSTVPPERQAEYQAWQARHGFREQADYDTAGAFLAGMAPVMVREDGGEQRPHLASIGLQGKVLKAPTHPSFWKTALVEIVRSVGGEGAEGDIPWDELGNRQQANAWLERYWQARR